MFFPGGNTTARKTCLGVLAPATVILCISAAVRAMPGHAAETPGPVVDSQAWQGRFEAWVETTLVEEQLEEAARNLPEFDRATTLRVLDELVMKRLESKRDAPWQLAEAMPHVRAQGLEGASLAAAQHYARGALDEALRLVEDPELEADAGAVHLRAQLLDEHTRSSHPSKRLETIGAYRYALSLAPDSPMARRARLRVGQIFLGLGFIPEAAAALRGLLDSPPTTRLGLAAHVSFAEASYLHRDAKTAIDTIVKLDPQALSPEGRRWAVQRMADSLFQLERFPAAIAAYRKAIQEAGEEVDPMVRLRLAAALLQTRKVSEAETQLRVMLLGDTPPQLAALGGLLLARAAREAESFQQASERGSEVLHVLPHSPEAALAAVEVLEAERLAGNGELNLPEAAFELLDLRATTPEFGLLAYRVASVPGPHGTEKNVRRWLGNLSKTLPEGAVRELAHEDLAGRLQAHLKEVYEETSKPDLSVLDEVEKFMRPMIVDENALLVGLETFYRLERWKSCMRWGRALYKREVRPIRRGLGAWRESQCRLVKEPELVSARRLLDVADSGKAGPFSLALASLAGEGLVRRGELPKAVRVYERALESVAEPRLLGPGLMRLGELQLSLGDLKLGMRRIVRGLSLTDDAEIATDPFRKAALIALVRALPNTKGAGSSQAAKLLRREHKRAEDWWKPAYAYLRFRAGVGSAPEGEDLFSRAASQLRRAERLEARIKKVVESVERAAAKEDAG